MGFAGCWRDLRAVSFSREDAEMAGLTRRPSDRLIKSTTNLFNRRAEEIGRLADPQQRLINIIKEVLTETIGTGSEGPSLEYRYRIFQGQHDELIVDQLAGQIFAPFLARTLRELSLRMEIQLETLEGKPAQDLQKLVATLYLTKAVCFIGIALGWWRQPEGVSLASFAAYPLLEVKVP